MLRDQQYRLTNTIVCTQHIHISGRTMFAKRAEQRLQEVHRVREGVYSKTAVLSVNQLRIQHHENTHKEIYNDKGHDKPNLDKE